MLIWSRKKKGVTEVEHCENCGRVLKWRQKRFCCEECERNARKLFLPQECMNALRFAILSRAKSDRQLDNFIRTPQFYQLFPELTPDQFKKGETK